MKNSSLNLRYTLCFLTRGDKILMLHRSNPPNQGLWNGVGGRLEAGKSPRSGILREVREETGFLLEDVTFAGLLTWEGFETPPGGLYLFTAEAPAGELAICNEGELAWKPRGWVLSAPEVVSNILIFGQHVLNGSPPQIYHFEYQDGQIIRYAIRPYPADGA